MLIDFSVKNYLSFKDQATLSMLATSGKELPENIVHITGLKKLPLLRSAVIYGANASGKSNIVKAMQFMKKFVLDSAKEGQRGDKISVKPFKLDQESETRPSSFEIFFLIWNKTLERYVRYYYGFTADTERVHEEWLTENRSKLIFERKYDKEEKKHVFKFGVSFKGEKKQISRMTRENALFLSVAAQLEHELAGKILDWFQERLNIAIFSDPGYGTNSLWHAKKLCVEEEKFKKDVLSLLRHADVGIDGLETDEEAFIDSDFYKNKLSNTLSDDEKKALKDTVMPLVFPMHTKTLPDGKKEMVQFEFYEESEGTKKLFSIMPQYLGALENGTVLIIDELEANMHPHLTQFLVKMFNDPQLNKKNAQLIITTHETNLLDSKVLRRDQIWFTEKNKVNSTELYSMVEFKPRKDLNIQKGYLNGRFGAIPFLGKFDL